jgi:hypothetical protein
MRENIGYVVGGSLRGNLRLRLTGQSEDVQEGSFVVIDSGKTLFYCLVTDLQLGSTDPRFSDEKFEDRIDPRLVEMLMGQTLYTNVEIMPVLMQETAPDGQLSSGEESQRPGPVKSIPEHHAMVRLAEDHDIANIFGKDGQPGNFWIGNTLDKHALKVCIDLRKFVKRSSGIFGATGTGKSFLTRMILAGLMKDKEASIFVFDMHNEYAADRSDPDQESGRIIGLKSKFKQEIEAYGLGVGTLINGTRATDLLISQKDIQAQDILLISKELNLRETTSSTIAALTRAQGENWFSFFMGLVPGKSYEDDDGKRRFTPDSVEGWAESANIHPIAASTLHSRLRKIMDKPYVVTEDQQAQRSLEMIVDSLQNGRHVILTFGKFDSDLDYLLVTNILTRRIREVWVRKTEKYNSTSKREDRPRPLVIAIEEAHKLLTKEMAAQTIFSTIAREMRKYFVTLLVIDQRPSQIDDEVMSQLGTRISGWLGDDADISAVLSGLASKEQLRGMLSHLNERQEVLLLGWGVPMPLPVHSRNYDQQFWTELMAGDQENNFDDLDIDSFNRMMKPKSK